MHAISSYRGNRPTNTQTHTQTHTHKPTDRTDYNTLCRSFAGAKCKYDKPKTQKVKSIYNTTNATFFAATYKTKNTKSQNQNPSNTTEYRSTLKKKLLLKKVINTGMNACHVISYLEIYRPMTPPLALQPRSAAVSLVLHQHPTPAQDGTFIVEVVD